MGIHSDERLKISVAQKKAIRQYYKIQVPRVGHKRIKEWFNEQYGIVLPFSTISNILSSKFDHLDQLGSNHDDAKRCRPPKYPDLEIALAECIGRMKTAGIDLTGAVLLNTAHELWPNIPAYRDLPIPALSGGWVEKFKTRHRLKLRSLQVEAASTRASKSAGSLGALEMSPTSDINKLGPPSMSIADSITLRALESIQLRTTNYSQNDIFSMTETELFWRLPPNATTLREWSSIPRYDNKERITVALACNASGTQKLPPYVVGHYATPRSFQAPGSDIKSLNCVYSSNRIAWMTVTEWRSWIKWFDSMMDRRVLLILDPHKSHEVAYQNLSDNYTLQNTEIVFLPASVSSLHSPLELGILQNFKALYRKTLLNFISEFYAQGDLESLLPSPVIPEQEFPDYNTKGGIPQGVQYIDQIVDPQRAINLYMALYWIQRAWMMDLSPSIIAQAWTRSTLVNEPKIHDGSHSVSPTFSSVPVISATPIQATDALSRPASVVAPELIHEISRLSHYIRGQTSAQEFMGNVLEALQPEYYIYPMEEAVIENVDDFIELSTAQFYESDIDPGKDPIYVIAPVSSHDADRAVKLLLNFEEQHPNSSVHYMQFLSEYKKILSQRSNQSGRQASIASIMEPMLMPLPGVMPPNMAPVSPSNSMVITNAPMSQSSSFVPKPPLTQRRRQDSQSSRAGTSISTSISRNNSGSSTTSIGVPDPLDSRISANRSSFNFNSGSLSFPPTSTLLNGASSYNTPGFYNGVQYNQTTPTYSSSVRSGSIQPPPSNASLFNFPYNTSAPQTSELPGNSSMNPYPAPQTSPVNNFSSLLSNSNTSGSNYTSSPYYNSGLMPRNSSESQTPQQRVGQSPPPQPSQPVAAQAPPTTQPQSGGTGGYSPGSSSSYFFNSGAPVYYPASAS